MGKIIKNKKILILFIVVLAFILRIYRVDMIPPSLYWDEAAMALDAKSVSLTGKDHHGNSWLQPIYPSWGDYKLPLYIISAAPFFKLINNNPELVVRLPTVIAGSLTVLVIYFLFNEIFKKFSLKNLLKSDSLKYTSYTASFLLAVSPWHIQFSRAAFEGNLALLFNSLAILFALKSSKSKKWLVLVLLFSVLGIYTYYSARIVVPIILFLVFIFFWKKDFKNIFSFVLTLLIIYLACLPLRKSVLAPQAEQLRLSTDNILNNEKIIRYSSLLLEQDSNSFIARKIHHRFLYQAKVLVGNYFDHFSLNYLILKGDSNLRHSTTRVGVIFLVGFIGLVYGQYLAFKSSKKLFIFLNLSLLITFLPACVPYEVPHSLRSLNSVLFLNIIAAFGLVQLIKVINNKKKNRNIILYLLILLFIGQFVLYLHDYFKHYPSRSFLDWQGGYKEVVEKMNQDYDNANKIIFTDAYSRPYLYFLLYSDYPIVKFQEERQEFLSENPLDYHETTKIDKIEFRKPNLKKDKQIDKVLIIDKDFKIWKNY